MKKLFLGIVIGSVLATSVTAFASNVKKMIEANYTVNKLVVNGKDTGKGKDAFISQGVTYVPIRTVSDALGNDISWYKDTKTIYINDKNNTTNTGEPTDLPSSNNSNTTSNKFITEEQAKKIAIDKVGGGSVIYIKADLDDKDDNPDYEIKVKNGNKIYEIEVDAISGKVTDFELED